MTRTAISAARRATLAIAAIALLTGPDRFPSAAGVPDDRQAIVHVLNRIGFGPRPGDVERVRAVGLRKYIDEQLHPQNIRDAGIDAHLAGLSTVTMSSREIAEKYAIPQLEARRERKRHA